MRAFVFLLVAIVGLSGCGMMKEMRGKIGSGATTEAAAQPETAPDTGDADDAAEPKAESSSEEAAEEEPRPVPRPEQTAEAKPDAAPATEPKNDPNAVARAACLAKGGTFQRAGQSGARTCVTRTRDANKSCSASSQCEGMCLARSGTCSPITPLSGCHDIVTNGGNMATVCLD